VCKVKTATQTDQNRNPIQKVRKKGRKYYTITQNHKYTHLNEEIEDASDEKLLSVSLM